MNPSKLFDLFDKARQHLKWPSLTIQQYVDEAKFDRAQIRLSSGTDLDIIWVSNGLGKGNPNNKLYGRFSRTNFIAYRNDVFDIIPIMQELCEDPIKFGALHVQQYKHCCFCNTELTSKTSLFAGYGPICADNWGLPWGEIKDESLEHL